MTTLQKTTILGAFAIVAGVGIYHVRESSALHQQIERLEKERAPFATRIAALRKDNERLSNLVAQAQRTPQMSEEEHRELLKLRGKSSVAAAASQEIARLKSELNQQSQKVPDYLTNAMTAGLATAENWKRKDSAERVARMKSILRLSDDQERAISGILTNRIQDQSKMAMDLLAGKLTAAQLQAEKAEGAARQEAEIKAQLTPEQLARYP